MAATSADKPNSVASLMRPSDDLSFLKILLAQLM
jgi:hypothetical protein